MTAAEAISPLSDRISFRPETPQDEAFLSKLYSTTRDPEMALTGWDLPQQQAFLRQQFQFQTTHYRQHYSDAFFRIILRDNAPIGRIYLHYGPSQIRLMDIALLPEYRGSGIGRSILQDLLQQAAELGKPVTLHVERFNPALRLYQRLGFQVIEDLGINLYMEWRPPVA